MVLSDFEGAEKLSITILIKEATSTTHALSEAMMPKHCSVRLHLVVPASIRMHSRFNGTCSPRQGLTKQSCVFFTQVMRRSLMTGFAGAEQRRSGFNWVVLTSRFHGPPCLPHRLCIARTPPGLNCGCRRPPPAGGSRNLYGADGNSTCSLDYALCALRLGRNPLIPCRR